MFCKKDVLRNFAKCRERHLRWNFFLNKIESFRPATLFKKRLRQRCFPMNFMKFLKAPFLQNTCGWLLLKKFNTFSLFFTKLRKREKRKYKVWPELKLILLKIKMLWRSQSTFNYWYQKMLFFYIKLWKNHTLIYISYFIIIFDQVYSNTRVSTRVNTNQHKSKRINTSLTRINTSLTRINTSQHESNTNQHESTRVQNK